MSKLNVVILNGALRTVDNPLFEELDNAPTVFVYVLTPYYFSKGHYTGIPSVGENRWRYLFYRLQLLREELKSKGAHDLLVLEGTYKQAVDTVRLKLNKEIHEIKAHVLYQPYAYELAYQEELQLGYRTRLIKRGISLFTVDDLVNIYKKSSNYFKSFHSNALAAFSAIKYSSNPVTSLNTIDVGLSSIDGDKELNSANVVPCFNNLKNYEHRRNAISGLDTTKLEAALSHGILSKAQVVGIAYNQLNSKTIDQADFDGLLRSLIWNEYCFILAHVHDRKIFCRHGLDKDLNKGQLKVLPDSVQTKDDWSLFYNRAMNQLRVTGYLPNRVRMMLGYYVIKVLGISHLAYAEYLEHYLVGYNPHNNWIGAHSCNGTGVDTVVGGRSFNIKRQLDDYDYSGYYK